MKYRFNVQVRGNVHYASQDELQAAINEKLAGVEGFTLISRSIEAWQDDGGLRTYENDLHRFTLQLFGNILADSELVVQQIISGFCTAYPEFVLTFQLIEGWQDGFGSLKQFNDDGTEYVEPTPEVDVVEEESKDDVEVEEVVVETTTEEQAVQQ